MKNRPIFFSASGYTKPTELAAKIGAAAGFTEQEIDALTQLLKPAAKFTATEENIAYLKAGLVEAEEFRSGNSSAPGEGFTGVRIGRAGFAYNAEDGWLLASVENDVLEVGINSTDGKLYFGGGAGWLDAEGIFIKNDQSAMFSFGDSANTRGLIRIKTGLANEFTFQNLVPGGNAGFKWTAQFADATTPSLTLKEDPVLAGRLLLDLGLGVKGAKITLGGEVEIHGKGASGGETKMIVEGNIGISGANGFLGLGAMTTLTIAAGVVTATRSYHTLDTQAGAATDDLDTINGGTEGDIVVLRAVDAARTVVVKDGTGNIDVEGDRTLDHLRDTITLIKSGSIWLELAFANTQA